jgi:AcrR family transcriptional regulator
MVAVRSIRERLPTLDRHPPELSPPLTKEKILAAAEHVLLRHGPAKATVVDVARVLGVSHANVYKFFASKADLRQAVVEAWLDRMDAPLPRISTTRASPPIRLRRWLDEFVGARRKIWRQEPQLFAALYVIAAEQPPAVWKAYKLRLHRSLARIIADGIATGDFKVTDAAAAVAAVADAHVRFYHPAHYREWSDPRMETAYQAVRSLVLAGLSTGAL